MNLLQLTLSGTIFILAVTAFRAAALRRLPKETFVALWWAAALRLLIPVSLPSRFSVYTMLDFLRPKAEAVPPPFPSPVLVIPSRPEVIPVPAPPPVSAPFPVWTALWITGGALLALWFLTRYVRWRLRFRESFPAECPGLDIWSHRSIQLRVTDQVPIPLTYGLLRPVILLPKTVDLRDEETLTCILAHEQAHIQRLDGVLKLVLTAALCVHWFNPAVWLLYVLANRDMELRCDEAAVLALGGDSRERYALTLIRLAELQNECVPLCGFSQKSGMEERIKAIMSIRKKSLMVCVTALVLALAITTVFATSAKPWEEKNGDSSDMSDGAEMTQLSEEVTAMWDDTLAPYVPFGLTYEFDDPDHDGNGLTMWYEGREVRGIFDLKSGAWITEHTGNGTYGPDAVELYAMYDGNGLIGLRFASEEEQAAWTEAREAGKAAVTALVQGTHYDSGSIYFTIPEVEGRWRIFIQGRIMTEDGMGMSVHYLAEESEKAEWVPGETYSFAVEDAAYDELTMEALYEETGDIVSCDLTNLLPKGGKPIVWPDLPKEKENVPEDAEMIWPVDSDKITQYFGDRVVPGGGDTTHHSGVDIGGIEAGTPVYAAGSGTVKDAGYNAQDGNYVRLDHGRGQETFYAHCLSVEVKTGDTVTAGQTIASVGSTGKSTGPHLHFEFLVDGVAVDPLAFDDENRYSSQLNLFAASFGNGEGENGETVWAGKPIIALLDGTVLEAGVQKSGYHPGPYVEVLYESGYSMEFTECQSVLVKTGDTVKAGDIIGYTGEHASASGPASPECREIEEKHKEADLQQMEEELVNGDYPRNSRGQTYGHDFYEYLGYSPDLIPVWASNGTSGYASFVEMNGFDPVTREAVKSSTAYKGGSVPIYDLEGNVIGEFKIESGKSGSAPEDFSTLEEAVLWNSQPDNR